MRLLIFLLVFYTCLSATVEAQTRQCALTLNQAPALRGFKLGMELKQAFEFLPVLELSPNTDEPGHNRAYVFTKYLPASKQKSYDSILKGVDYVSLEFKNNKVAYITVTYDNSIQWDNVQQFTARVTNTFHFPLNQWRIVGNTTYINCGSFTIVARVTNSSATLSLMDNIAMRTPEEIRKAEEEKKRRGFKP